MGYSFSAELLKLRKRPATWMIGIIFVALILLLGYLSDYLLVVNASEEDISSGFRDMVLNAILPESFLPAVLGIFSSFGIALALIFGALAIGSEYGWDTFKVSLTQRPGRLGFLAGKLLSVGVLLLVVTVVTLVIGAVASYAVAISQDAAVEWPSVLDMLKGVGVGWLILATFAAMGVCLAALFRGTALAIGIGLVYLLALENLLLNLTSRNETIAAIGERLPATSAVDLSKYFGNVMQGFVGSGEMVKASESSAAALTLGIYTVVFVVLTILFFKSRDVN